MKSVQRRVAEIGRAARAKGEKGKQKLPPLYIKMLGITGRIVAQAKQFSAEITGGVKRSLNALKQARLNGLKREIETMITRTEQVVSQTKARIIGGDTHVEGKLLSVFEPSTEIIRKGKASKPTNSARW